MLCDEEFAGRREIRLIGAPAHPKIRLVLDCSERDCWVFVVRPV
jgi:hypothetical protein